MSINNIVQYLCMSEKLQANDWFYCVYTKGAVKEVRLVKSKAGEGGKGGKDEALKDGRGEERHGTGRYPQGIFARSHPHPDPHPDPRPHSRYRLG